MRQAYANGLTPIYCVGEKLEEREDGRHFDVVKAQLEEVIYHLTPEQFERLIVAYEPVWAIGTGKTATADQAQEMHAHIRRTLAAKFGAAAEQTPILYGGSCKPSNAGELFAKEDVDGGLIGGAALEADSFLQIGKAFLKYADHRSLPSEAGVYDSGLAVYLPATAPTRLSARPAPSGRPRPPNPTPAARPPFFRRVVRYTNQAADGPARYGTTPAGMPQGSSQEGLPQGIRNAPQPFSSRSRSR